jgi:hypothetical protein
MSCIQDFTRVKPRRQLMWGVAGGVSLADGAVRFLEPAADPAAHADAACGLLWHHDTIEWGPTRACDHADMWRGWNLGRRAPTGEVVDEPPWWRKYGVGLPTYSVALKDVASLGADGVWRFDPARG